MSISAISSDPGRLGGPCLRAGLLALALILLALPERAGGQEVLGQQEALRIAFPAPTVIERRTAFLTPEQRKRAAQLAGRGVAVESGVVTYYVGTRHGVPVGVAYFDAHRVRTLPEVLMVVVDPEKRVQRVEVLKFSEPPQYRPPRGWLQQFAGRLLSPRLSVRRDVANLTGATLTAEAVVRATRRTLALHEVIAPIQPERTSGGR